MTLFVRGTLLLLFLVFIPSACACPSALRCSNFSDTTKRTDCNYIVSQGFPRAEQQEIICTLWDGTYDYEAYQSPHYPALDTDLTLSYNEIDTSTFILASKVLALIGLSYCVYCVLTRPSFIRKWFVA